MNIKTASYTLVDGLKKDFSYDVDSLCLCCNLPITEASIGGTAICPWCDCGVNRDGIKWTYKEAVQYYNNFKINLEERNK